MKPRTLAWCLVVLGLAGVFNTKAEVSARLSAETGEYEGMIIKYPLTSRRVWTGPAPTLTRRPLNPTGDVLGDLAPTVVENPNRSNWPTAVWSHPNGPDYDLIFSCWTGSGWTPGQFVQADNFSNDLEPRLGFNTVGRPYMTWWSDEGGVGSVYFSIFLATRWMTPIRVSVGGVDSRHADLVIESDQRVRINYDTGEVRRTRILTIPNSDTITDDIDPKFRSQISIN